MVRARNENASPIRMPNSFKTPRLLICVCFLVGLPAALQAATSVNAELAKESAWTGEAVPLIVTLYSPGPFSGTASFDLPELPQTVFVKVGNPVVGSETVEDEQFVTQRHEFAIYTQRSGEVVIPSFQILFAGKKSPLGEPEPVEAETPELRFQSKRPPGSASMGVVLATDQMECSQSWNPADQVPLLAGDVVERTILREAVGTTSMLMSPVSSDIPVGVRVYTSTPQVEDRTSRGEVNAVRRETLKYQFERQGTFDLPDISLAWWNTRSGELERMTLPGRSISVEAGVLAESDATKEAANPWVIIGGILGGGFLVWVCRPPAKKLFSIWHTHRHNAVASAARQVEAACQSNDAHATYAALLTWQRLWAAHHSDESMDRMEQAASEAGLLREWETLSAYVFGKEIQGSKWSGTRLRVVFKEVHKAMSKDSSRHLNVFDLPTLPTLNPTETTS